MKYRIVKYSFVNGNKPSFAIQIKPFLLPWQTTVVARDEHEAQLLFDSLVNTGRVTQLEVLSESK